MKTTIAVLKDAGELTVSGLVFVTLVMTISRTNLLMSDLLYMLFLLITFPYLSLRMNGLRITNKMAYLYMFNSFQYLLIMVVFGLVFKWSLDVENPVYEPRSVFLGLVIGSMEFLRQTYNLSRSFGTPFDRLRVYKVSDTPPSESA